MLQSEVAYRAYYAMYNKFMDTRFETTEAAIAASHEVSAQLVVYKDACEAEHQASEAAYALTAEGIQEAADIAAYRAYNAQFEATDEGIPCLTVHPEPRGWFCNVVGEQREYNLYSNLDGSLYCMYIPTDSTFGETR